MVSLRQILYDKLWKIDKVPQIDNTLEKIDNLSNKILILEKELQKVSVVRNNERPKRRWEK